MARYVVALLGLAIQSPVTFAAEPPNLLRNGGLEQIGPDGLPVGFGKAIYGAQPEIAFDVNVFKEGRRSMRISAREPSDTAVAQDVQLKPETAYCFSGWTRTQDLVPEDRSWTYGTFQIQDPKGRLIARLGNHKGTTDWTNEKVCFLSPPDGKVHVVCFFVGFGKGTGTAWFDDLRLEEVSGGGEITITGKRLQREPISPMIYGNFMELLSDLVPAMWAEKLDGTSFEYLRTPQERELHRSRFTFDPKRDPHDRPWRLLGKAPQAECELDAERPFNGQVSQRIRLRAGGTEAGIAQDGIFVEKGESYRFIGHFRQCDQAGPVLIEIRRGQEVIAREAIHGVTADWTERHVTLIPAVATTAGTLAIRISTPGTVWIDRVSLMPTKTVAGWRPDAVAAIRAMKPGVIRWGGSIIEGYSWRDGVGPWQKRVPFPNRYWGRVDPNVVGIDEFVAFCRATGAEPLICVRWSGQKPSDAAEMVEYCNDPASTPLGSLRAKNGHREPYGVKFWQIGNEGSGPAYDASFAGFATAMRKADPSIKIFASYVSENLLKNAADLIDFVCPHHYACADLAGTEAETRHYAELLNRFAPGRPIKLAVTEWNTTAGDWGQGRHHLWTLANGLACARYLNLCHRWSDLVKIACRSNMANSYCSGIIQTNNHAWYGTPAWHVAKLYAEHGGTHPLVVEIQLGMLELDVSANLSADGKSLSLIAVNSRGKSLTKTVNVAAFAEIDARADVWTITNDDAVSYPEATNSFTRPERIAARARSIANAGKKFSYMFPPYSVTLIRLHRPATSRVLR
jgi:alpha-N-arabinofuranosidase